MVHITGQVNRLVSNRVNVGRYTVLTNAEEKIVQLVKRMANRGLPVRRDYIVSLAQKMLEDEPDRVAPFSGWKLGKVRFQAFLRRHKGLSVRKPEHISKARLTIIGPYIREWFATLRPNLVNQPVTTHQPHRFRMSIAKTKTIYIGSSRLLYIHLSRLHKIQVIVNRYTEPHL